MATTHPHPLAPDRNDSPDSSSTRRRVREAVLVGLLALTLNLAGNGRVSLWDRDEPRYAGCTREMRASGDWIHPTFNAEPRYHKPVLIYWLMLAGTAIGGDNPFGARLVSALAGAGTCLLVWAWGRRMLGRSRSGSAAALILATAPIMVAESKLATTDATLTFLVVGCQFALWELARGAVEGRGGRLLGPPGAGDADEGAGRPGPDRRLGGRLVVVGRADRLLEAARDWRWGLAGFAAADGPLVRRDRAGLARRFLPGRGRLPRHPPGDDGDRGARRLPRLLPGDLAGDLLPLVGPAARRPWSGAWARRRSHPAFGFLLGWVGRALDPPGMRADEADPLLPAGLPGLRPAGGLAGRDPGRGARSP